MPVTPQSLVSFVFDCQRPVDHQPLTEDSSGVILRPEGAGYITAISTGLDVEPWTFDSTIDYAIFDEQIWPRRAHRIPAFEAIKLRSAWVGHFDYNHFDQNAFIGEHPSAPGLLFVSGFSGHGLQHSPAAGRAVSELITYGECRSLDVGRFGLDRLLEDRPIEEAFVIGIR